MPKFIVQVLLAVLVLSTSSVFLAAAEFKSGSIVIKDPWGRATISNRPGVTYAMIHNMGSQSDTLKSASSPIAERIEIHTHTMTDGVMQMRKVDSLDIPANGMAMLKPGGHHLMMFGLSKALKKGQLITVTLTFEKAGSVDIMVPVGSIGASGPDHSGHSQ